MEETEKHMPCATTMKKKKVIYFYFMCDSSIDERDRPIARRVLSATKYSEYDKIIALCAVFATERLSCARTGNVD